jgi:hypothetical protein
MALAACARSDPEVNKFILGMVAYQGRFTGRQIDRDVSSARAHELAAIRSAAIVAVRTVVHRRLALKPLLMVLAADMGPNRVEAIGTLVVIHDEDNHIAIKKALQSFRYDKNPQVRATVEDALKQIDK